MAFRSKGAAERCYRQQRTIDATTWVECVTVRTIQSTYLSCVLIVARAMRQQGLAGAVGQPASRAKNDQEEADGIATNEPR